MESLCLLCSLCSVSSVYKHSVPCICEFHVFVVFLALHNSPNTRNIVHGHTELTKHKEHSKHSELTNTANIHVELDQYKEYGRHTELTTGYKVNTQNLTNTRVITPCLYAWGKVMFCLSSVIVTLPKKSPLWEIKVSHILSSQSMCLNEMTFLFFKTLGNVRESRKLCISIGHSYQPHPLHVNAMHLFKCPCSNYSE